MNITVNEVDDINVNYMAAKHSDGRFNSTMKPRHHRDSKEYSSRGKNNDSSHNKPWQNSR